MSVDLRAGKILRPPTSSNSGTTPSPSMKPLPRIRKCWLIVIQKLAQTKLEGWCNKLGAAGIAAWKHHFCGMSKEQIVKEVQRLLEGNDRSRLFYYRDVTVDSSGATKKKGIFQSPAFSRVIAVHCHATAMGGVQGPFEFADDNADTWPEGVITMSVHALKRGLNYFRTGELVIPSPPTGNFSKTNWAASTTARASPRGFPVPLRLPPS
ncbi:hypothetical protein B0H14DRAFT_64786 [Mycena olivaceomarginata]|nr:hypothetical protein B0H14DRAFT_64786 [Mycena olivaceomarginata]